MSLDLIRAIVEKRWETGAFGTAHFLMPRDLLDQMPRPEPDATPRLPDPFGDLLSIPIVVDDSLPAGAWRLVDTITKETLFTGSVSPADEAQT